MGGEKGERGEVEGEKGERGEVGGGRGERGRGKRRKEGEEVGREREREGE